MNPVFAAALLLMLAACTAAPPAAAYAAQPAVSAYECEECGEAIPEERRAAVPGCRCCTACQQEIERYGKTRFAAGRN